MTGTPSSQLNIGSHAIIADWYVNYPTACG